MIRSTPEATWARSWATHSSTLPRIACSIVDSLHAATSHPVWSQWRRGASVSGGQRRARHHHGLAQVQLVHLEAHAGLGPEARQDVQVALEEAAALLERHADRVELARVPARGGAQDQPRAPAP